MFCGCARYSSGCDGDLLAVREFYCLYTLQSSTANLWLSLCTMAAG